MKVWDCITFGQGFPDYSGRACRQPWWGGGPCEKYKEVHGKFYCALNEEVPKMKKHKYDVYLSGRMTNAETSNPVPGAFDVFNEVAEMYRAEGLVVCNPAEMSNDLSRPCMMRRDMKKLLKSTAICMLPRWQLSDGAVAELFMAITCGMDVTFYHATEGVIMSDIKALLPLVARKVMEGLHGGIGHAQHWSEEETAKHLLKAGRHANTAAQFMLGHESAVNAEVEEHLTAALTRAAMAYGNHLEIMQ